MKLNKFQKAAKNKYANGDFNYINDNDDYRDVGDSLFSFIMIELSDNEDCEDRDTAINRLYNAIDDLEMVVRAVENS